LPALPLQALRPTDQYLLSWQWAADCTSAFANQNGRNYITIGG